jgi:hypothetical protein
LESVAVAVIVAAAVAVAATDTAATRRKVEAPRTNPAPR